MTLNRVAQVVVIAAIAMATEASAQMFGPGTPQFGAPPPQQQQQGPPPCLAQFAPLREDAQKRAQAIQAGVARKAGREEICGLFKRFADAEAKVVKYLTTNQAACGIPPTAIAETKANHAKTTATQHKVCSAEAGPEGRPRGTGLGEALGVRAVPTPETTKTGKGIFDTLSGTQLAQ